ncbi:MAG: hypothetical protein OWT28_05220 [Firmicutes bacterium]|nr:hypothetical protein [Bacillota bacterium]
MEKETRVLLWGLFSIAVMTAGFIPVAWTTTQRAADTGVVANAHLAAALWGQSTAVPADVAQSTEYPQATAVAIIPGALTPKIASIQWNTTTFPPQVTIRGGGFGNPASPRQDVLTLTDDSRGWQANNTTSPVIAHILSWTNNEIVIDDFTGYGGGDSRDLADGLGSFVFAPGDQIGVSVTNPQTGSIGTEQTQFPNDASMPTVTVTPSSETVSAGQTITISGTVTFAGNPLDHQAVNLSAASGTFTAIGGAQVTPADFMVDTDGSGQFSVTWIAPDQAGLVPITVMADGVTAEAHTNVITPPLIQSVVWNTTTWPPQITISGQRLGSGFAPDDITVDDTTRQWNTSDLPITVSSTADDNAIDITGMSPYGGGDGQWLFARGDAVELTVRNPQTNLSGMFETTYPMMAALPSVSLAPLASLEAGQSGVITGRVTFAGVGVADQTVDLVASAGAISGMTGNTASVTTDASGDFTATYTAPGTEGAQTITATCDGSTTTDSVPVQGFVVTLVATGDQTDNTVTLTATVNEPLRGYPLRIVDETTGQTLAQTTQGTTLFAQITAPAEVTNTYIAQIG